MALGIHPREAWAYIKARRRQPRPKKFERRQTSASRNFLCRKQAESVFPLKCGTIEAYLPEGYRSRKRDKLIRLLATEGFWAKETSGSAIISTRSRKLSLNRRYQRMQRMVISWSKWGR